MTTIVYADNLPEEIYGPLLEEAGIDYINATKGNLEDLLNSCSVDCVAIVVRSQTYVDASLLSKVPNVQVVGRAGTGVDNVDVVAATARGVIVENTPSANTESAADHAMGLIYALSRNIPAADASLKRGEWERNRYLGTELSGKVLGLIGFGRVGRGVAERGKAAGMTVLECDPYVDEKVAGEYSARSVSLDELLRTSDYVSLHTTLTPENEGMIGKEELSKMKPTARLINVARGGLVDEQALYEALGSHQIAGAALDTFGKEPYRGPLRELGDLVILTPHLGAATEEAQQRVAEQITKQLIAYFKEGKIINAVNVSIVAPEIKPFVSLVERMGYLAGKLAEGPVRSLEVTCHGEIAEADIRGISTYGLVGLLTDKVNFVNIVNAREIADGRGIEVSEATSSTEIDYRSMVSLKVTQPEGEQIVLNGMMYEKRGPRIVGFNGYDIEFKPEGTVLVTYHEDKLGIVGYIGSTLAKYGINIDTINLSNEAIEGRAVAVIRIDTPAPEDALAEIANKEIGIYDVRQITLAPPTTLL